MAHAKELETQAAQLEAHLGGRDAGSPKHILHKQQQPQQQARVPKTKPMT